MDLKTATIIDLNFSCVITISLNLVTDFLSDKRERKRIQWIS